MKTFNFKLDQECTVWFRTVFEIQADNLQDAKKVAIEYHESGFTELLGWEILEDTITVIPNKEQLIASEDGLNLYENLYENQNILDIKVKDPIEVTPLSIADEVEQAKNILKKHGYFVDNLWAVSDVMVNSECTEEEAQLVLSRVFACESTYDHVWHAIGEQSRNLNLKPRQQDEDWRF